MHLPLACIVHRIAFTHSVPKNQSQPARKPSRRISRSFTALMLAFLFGIYAGERALADSITVTESWVDSSKNGNVTTKDTGTLNASLTIPGMSAMTADDWSNCVISINMSPYDGSEFTSDVMSDAPNTGGKITTTSATFYYQGYDTNGDFVNIEELTFTRSGDTLTIVDTTLNPPAWQPPSSLLAEYYLNSPGAITDQQTYDVNVQDDLDDGTALNVDDTKILDITGTDTVTTDSFGNNLNNVQVSASANFTLPTLTQVSPPGTTTTTTTPLLNVQVNAASANGIANVEFYWNGFDFGPGSSTTSGAWSELFALMPGANTFQMIATDNQGNQSAPDSITVTYNNTVTNPSAIQFSEHYQDSTQVDSSGNNAYAFTQDVGVLNAALPVAGLQAMSATTWSNLVFTLSFGNLNFSNSLKSASVITPTSATFNVTDSDLDENVFDAEQLTITRVGNNLVILKRTGNPSYASDNTPLIANTYVGDSGTIKDQKPLSLSLLDGTTLNPYTSVAETIYITGTDTMTKDSYNKSLNNIQVTGSADYTPPVNTITAPTAGELWSNVSFTVTGKSTDNVMVANVFYSINGSTWTSPSMVNNTWSNWTVNVSLVPGTNTLQVYSVDSNGNISVTNTVKFDYILSAPLTVNEIGEGSINPPDNGALLAIGSNYSLTAAGTNGFKFTGWTGSQSTNSPTLLFTMASNLVFTANFVDTNLPTVSITSPTANQLWSNASFTVTGKAADNFQVASVMYAVNGGNWNPATPGVNNWSNWTAQATLTPGTNTIQAYSVDAAGNFSLTNTVKMVYVLSATLAVNEIGEGSLTPVYNNALLQIGKIYFMTAAGTNGFKFTGWTGSQSTNGATISFTMASNLMFTANFVDTNLPTVSITSPTANQLWSNASFTVTGKAADNFQVASVMYAVNGGNWNPATPGVNNWSNWTAQATLTPGTNTIQAYSVDAAGNFSLTNTVKMVYVLSATLAVNEVGEGSLTPVYNNALLQIGKIYFMTAAGTNGFKFTGWTGSQSTNGATISFTMASNLMFTANFVDTNLPTVSITSPTANQLWSNASFTVTGKAADNFQVAGVMYAVNGGNWNPATPGVNNWSNWTAQATLTPGTNTIQAYSVDAAGNFSLTNIVKMVYVLSATLAVNEIGEGSLTPVYNNALLQIGKIYFMTAAGTNGFKFTGWTGSQSTNGATISFTMASNLMFTANFADTNPPTFSITNLAANQHVSNGVFVVQGKAADNYQVASVNYQLNGADWTNAQTGNGWTNWYASLDLVPGTNNLKAYAMDSSGNVSATNNLNFFYVVSALLQIETAGVGKLTPNYSNAVLAIGQTYSITSAPAAGFVFTNWVVSTNWIGGAFFNQTNLQFMMSTNLTLQANFVEVSKPTVTITAPTANQRMPSAAATVNGTASDAWQVSGLWYSLNGGPWTSAPTTNNWTNWSQTVALVAGTNKVQAYALDLGGNYSSTSSVSFYSSNTFALQMSLGTLSANGLTFSLDLSSNLTGHVQYSTNLINWINLTNFNGTNSVLNFRDPGATNSPHRFYRAAIP